MPTTPLFRELHMASVRLGDMSRAIINSKADATARHLLDEVAAQYGLNTDDMERIAVLALAHCYARLDVEENSMPALDVVTR